MSDTAAVLVALITAIAATVNVIITSFVLLKTRQTHDLVNGLSHESQAAQSGQARAEGFTEGEQAQRARHP